MPFTQSSSSVSLTNVVDRIRTLFVRSLPCRALVRQELGKVPLVIRVRVRVGVSEPISVPQVRKRHGERQRVEVTLRPVGLVPQVTIAACCDRCGITLRERHGI